MTAKRSYHLLAPAERQAWQTRVHLPQTALPRRLTEVVGTRDAGTVVIGQPLGIV